MVIFSSSKTPFIRNLNPYVFDMDKKDLDRFLHSTLLLHESFNKHFAAPSLTYNLLKYFAEKR